MGKSNKPKKNKSQGLELIKPLPKTSGDLISKNIDELEYPVFSFKFLQSDSIKVFSDSDFFFKYLMRLKTLSELVWNDIIQSARHSFGTEKYPINKIKPCLPNNITPDIKELTVFRAVGDKRAFMGFQTRDIFHVVFIESKFNDIYEH